MVLLSFSYDSPGEVSRVRGQGSGDTIYMQQLTKMKGFIQTLIFVHNEYDFPL